MFTWIELLEHIQNHLEKNPGASELTAEIFNGTEYLPITSLSKVFELDTECPEIGI